METIKKGFEGGVFNTLVQSGTTRVKQKRKIVNCKGVDLSNAETVHSKAKRKQISQIIAVKLAELSISKGNELLAQKFWNTYHCLNKVEVAEGKMFGKYCKNRICTVCSSIRKAEIINKYFDEIKKWPDPHFVTLTCKSVAAYKLEALMKNMLLGLHKIIEKYKKRNQRETGKRLIGIRSLECNFNPVARTYNPHFHMIVPDKETGDIFIEEWLSRPLLKRTKTRWTIQYAQKNLKIVDIERCLIEVVKYSTKIFTGPEGKGKTGMNVKLYIKALYNILESMQGKRIFDRFGFDLSNTAGKKEFPLIELKNFKEYFYVTGLADWVEDETNERLTNYSPDGKLQSILKNCIDEEIS